MIAVIWKRLSLLLLLAVGCGDDNGNVSEPESKESNCIEGGTIRCGDVYSKDLLYVHNLMKIDVLREFIAEKRTIKDSPWSKVGKGIGDIDDLMYGVLIAKEIYGINPVFALALSAQESLWGKSRIARLKRNLWGWEAYDHCPFRCARKFTSYRDGFNIVFARIKKNYLTEGGKHYQRCGDKTPVTCANKQAKQADACGVSLAGMNCRYTTSSDWGAKIRRIMNQMINYINQRCKDVKITTVPPIHRPPRIEKSGSGLHSLGRIP